MRDPVVLHQGIHPDVTVGTKKRTRSVCALMQVSNCSTIAQKASSLTYLLFTTAKLTTTTVMPPIKTWSGPNCRPTFPWWNRGRNQLQVMERQKERIRDKARQRKERHG